MENSIILTCNIKHTFIGIILLPTEKIFTAKYYRIIPSLIPNPDKPPRTLP